MAGKLCADGIDFPIFCNNGTTLKLNLKTEQLNFEIKGRNIGNILCVSKG